MITPKLEQEIDLLHRRVCPAMGDPKRLLILYALDEQPLSVNDLAALLRFPQPTVSRHLRVLRERGLALTERRGANVYYRLADRRLLDAVDLLRAVLASQLAADASLAQSLM